MRTRTTAAVGAVALLLALTTAACGSEPTRAEIEKRCVAAIKAQPDGDKAKPKACDPLPEKDYTALVAAHVIDELGWTDEDGNFDKNEMLEDTLEDQP